MGVMDTAKTKGLESLDLEFAWGRRMRVYVHKIGATSRRSRGFSWKRRYVPGESDCNVAT